MDLEMLAAGQDGAPPVCGVVLILELERLAQAANDLGCNSF